MCSRSGVRRAEIHALEISASTMRARSECCERAADGLFNGHRPATIDEARDKAGAKAVVDVHDGHVRRA